MPVQEGWPHPDLRLAGQSSPAKKNARRGASDRFLFQFCSPAAADAVWELPHYNTTWDQHYLGQHCLGPALPRPTLLEAALLWAFARVPPDVCTPVSAPVFTLVFAHVPMCMSAHISTPMPTTRSRHQYACLPPVVHPLVHPLCPHVYPHARTRVQELCRRLVVGDV